MNYFSNTLLANSTASNYNSKINKWVSIMPQNENSLQFIYTNPNYSVVQLRQYLVETNVDTAQTLNSYIKAIFSVVEHNKELFSAIKPERYNKATLRWKELRQKTYEYANAYRYEQKPSPTQSQKVGSTMKFNELESIRDELPDDSIDKLLLGFYTYVPPVRADLFATQIVQTGEKPSYPNYIVFSANKSHLVLTDFKTSELYKEISYDLPYELHRLLNISLKDKPRRFLFMNRFGQSFKRNKFSEWTTKRLTALFKKQFTLTLFRHIYISSLPPDTNAEVLFEISKKMGHSITQHMLYRWREQPDKIVEVD